MTIKLVDELDRIASLANLGGTTNWAQLNIDSNALREIDATTDADLLTYRQEILRRFSAVTRPQEHLELAQLYEVYAEALVLLELQKRAAARGFTVIRTPPAKTNGVQTPDFACEKDGVRFYIEVKTPDIVGGIYAADDMANDILKSRADLDGRKKPGVTFGKEVELRPHGDVDGQNSTLIDALIRRICNAVKKQQLTYGPTILLVFTGRLPFDAYEPCCLVPAYFRPSPPMKSGDTAFPGECESGLWWYIGYGEPGDQILGRSDFEGKGNLVGRIANHGVLVQHPYLIGLSVMSKPWSSNEYRIHSLANTERKALPAAEQFGDCDPEEAVSAISDGWNAQDNGNGIRYQMRT